MAQEGPLTPEKQLLTLIEKPEAKDAVRGVQKIKRHSLSLFSPSAWMSRFSFFKDKGRAWVKEGGFRQFDIGGINKLLVLSIIALAFYFITNTSISIVNLRKISDLDFEIPESTGTKTPYIVSSLKASSFYVDKIRERDIFQFGGREEAPEEVEASAPPPVSIVEQTESLKLVGISWSKDPDAMIEDIRIPRTYFVKRGEMIGEVKVEAIFKNKVVLSYEGSEIELK